MEQFMKQDAIVAKMIKERIPLTVANYVALAFWDKPFDELEGEELCEVLELVEDGVLVHTESDFKN
jgi:hypothetical protein